MTIQDAKDKLIRTIRNDENLYREARITDAIEALIRAVVEDLISRPTCRHFIVDFAAGRTYNCNKPEGHVSKHGCGDISWDDP